MRIFPPCPGLNFDVDHRVGSSASYNDLITWAQSSFSLESLGKDQSGDFDLYGFGLGNQANPCILIVANQHGWERGGSHFGVEFLRRVKDKEHLDNELNSLDQFFYFYMLVSANPYGYEHGDYYNSRGVNINRNYDLNFESTGSGEYPFSEAETQIIRDLVLSLKPFAIIDNHMWGGSEITGIGMGNDDLNPLFPDKCTRTAQLVTGSVFNVWDQNPSATLRNWGATQNSKNGGKALSILLEVRNVAPENYARAYDGINGYATICLYLKDYFLNRVII